MSARVAWLAVAALLAAGCTSKTDFGPCVGVTDDRDPSLTYKVNTLNVVIGVIFVETIIVPVVVLFDELTCPVDRKAARP